MYFAIPVNLPTQYQDRLSAISHEGTVVTLSLSAISVSLSRSDFFNGQRSVAMSDVIALSRDGIVAYPVAYRAKQFLSSIPSSVPFPEVSADDEGFVILDWSINKDIMVSVSISDSRRIPYAYLEGTKSGSGVVTFTGTEIPLEIWQLIQRVKVAA